MKTETLTYKVLIRSIVDFKVRNISDSHLVLPINNNLVVERLLERSLG